MDFQSDSDVVLMLRVRNGDHAAFEALIEKYRKPLVNVIARYLGEDRDAEDLAQDVFVRVYRAAPRYEPSAKFSTWLYTIARRLCANYSRGRALRKLFSLSRDDEDDEPLSDAAELADPRSEDPSVSAEKEQLRRIVAAAVAALPKTLRFAVILRRYEDMSYEEIAAVLNCSVTAAKLRVHRANTLLAERLAPYLGDATR
jgi:RNA polymerase sigma-70 factor (ECF subfamily)